jgi:hypothetical protein
MIVVAEDCGDEMVKMLVALPVADHFRVSGELAASDRGLAPSFFHS